MTINVLFSDSPGRWETYELPLLTAFAQAGLDVDLRTNHPPEEVDYIVFSPGGPVRDFSRYPRLKAVFSLWAGVETIVDNPTLKVPLARMVDRGLTQGMVEYVTGHVLRYHLGIDHCLEHQDGNWDPLIPPLARDRKVGILGAGALGAACGQALTSLGFTVLGWSRREKALEGIECHHGQAGLRDVLAASEILVLLLPKTPETENILNTATLALLPEDACIINPGRGALIDDHALLAAIDGGHVSRATLDVFRTEPLPSDHPYWSHPKVTVTPHVASETRPDTASEVIAENLRRAEAGEDLLYLVDREAGY